MSELDNVDLSRAEASFGLANAPLFLMDRLIADPAIQAMARNFSGSQLLVGIKNAIRKAPVATADAAKPYAYLVAISLQHDLRFLEKASRLRPEHLHWYSYLSRVLMKGKTPTLTNRLDPKNISKISQSWAEAGTMICNQIIEEQN